jgi:hypothetical protein
VSCGAYVYVLHITVRGMDEHMLSICYQTDVQQNISILYTGIAIGCHLSDIKSSSWLMRERRDSGSICSAFIVQTCNKTFHNVGGKLDWMVGTFKGLLHVWRVHAEHMLSSSTGSLQVRRVSHFFKQTLLKRTSTLQRSSLNKAQKGNEEQQCGIW